MAFLDFAALKEAVTIEQAIDWLGLDLREGNQQFRGSCPTCKSSGPRSLVITPSKQAFYCFAERLGGDVIALVAHIQQMNMKEAAEFLVKKGSVSTPGSNNSVSTVPPERIKKDTRSLQPLNYLEPGHAKIKNLSISKETCIKFAAGYAPKGIMRGKFAFPIHDADGQLIAYGGISLDDPSAELTFPKDFNPELALFNHHQQNGDEIILCRSALEVVQLHENGIENAIAFLIRNLSSDQLEVLAKFLENHEDMTLVMP